MFAVNNTEVCCPHSGRSSVPTEQLQTQFHFLRFPRIIDIHEKCYCVLRRSKNELTRAERNAGYYTDSSYGFVRSASRDWLFATSHCHVSWKVGCFIKEGGTRQRSKTTYQNRQWKIKQGFKPIKSDDVLTMKRAHKEISMIQRIIKILA